MKTRKIITGFLALAIIFFMTSFSGSNKTASGKAPCPYSVVNKLPCPVKVSITVYVQTGTSCTTVCNFNPGITVAPFSSVAIPCCANMCNVVVQLQAIGGTAVSVGAADFFNGVIALPTICGASAYNFDSTIPGFVIY